MSSKRLFAGRLFTGRLYLPSLFTGVGTFVQVHHQLVTSGPQNLTRTQTTGAQDYPRTQTTGGQNLA